MESLRIAFEIVLPIFLLLVVGYVVKLTGMMNETSVRQANSVVFKIFLPILIFKNIFETDLSSSFNSKLLLFSIAGVAFQFMISLCLVLLSEHDNARRGVMLQGMFRSNFVLFGIPISTALFGDDAAGLAAVLIAVIIPLYNVLAVVSLESFNGKKPSFFKILAGILTNPLILASAVGLIFVYFHIPLPAVISKTVSDLASIATPLAFVLLGASFSFGDISQRARPLSLTLCMKLIIYPLLFIGLAILFGFRGAPLAVLLTVFGSPIAVSSFTMAQQMGGDDKLAGQLVVFSSLLSVLTIFLLIFGLRELGMF